MKKRIRKTRMDKEIALNMKDGMTDWQAFKAAWHKLHYDARKTEKPA